MAEAIGLAASVASLLDLALKLSVGLHDLQFHIRNAPYLIDALENETNAIRLVLTHVENTIQSATTTRQHSPGSASILSDLATELGKSETILKQLVSFTNSLRIETSTLRRVKWTRKKAKAVELMRDLKKLRMRISELQLAYSNSSLTRIELLLQDIQIMQRREYAATCSLGACIRDTKDQHAVDRNTTIQSQSDIAAALKALQSATPTLPPDWVERISHQLVKTTNNFQSHPTKAEYLETAKRQAVSGLTESGVQCSPQDQSDNTAVSPHRTHKQGSFEDASSPLRHSTLEFKLKLVQSQCSISCVCRCHTSVSSYRPWNAFPKGLQMIIGSMFFEYSTYSVSTVTCDLRSCSKLRSTRLTLRYHFPFWSFKYAIHVLVEKLSTKSLTFNLALRRITRMEISKDNILYHALVGNLSDVKRIMFENPTAVLDVDYNGNSALHTSTRAYNPWKVSLQIWEALLRAGADPDQVNAEGLSFRQYIAHLILQNSIPLNLQTEVQNLIQTSQCLEDFGMSFLHDIVVGRCPIDLSPVLETGKTEIVAQVNNEDRFGMTPLMYAVKLGDEKAARVLIKAGASVHKEGPFGTPILDYVGSLPPNSCATLLNLLLAAGANPNAVSAYGRSLLHTAAIHDNITMMNRLLQKGVRPDCLGPRGNRPIHYAASQNSAKVVRLLYEKGVNMNVLADNGLSPLGVAIQHNAPDAQSSLLELGADHLVTGERGTLFHLAADSGREKTFETLSSFKLKDLNVDAWNGEGLTATDVFEKRYDKTPELISAFYTLKDSMMTVSLEERQGIGKVEDKDISFDAYEFL